MKNNIPKRYENADFSLIKPGLAEFVNEMIKNVRKNKGFYLHGAPGVGKTYSAWAIVRHLSSCKVPVWMVKSSEVVEAIKNTFGGFTEDSMPFHEFLEDISTFKGVVIFDDVGAEKYPEGVTVAYLGIIDARYEDLLPMSFTSNVDLNELKKRMSERIVSRIHECCTVFTLESENKRI